MANKSSEDRLLTAEEVARYLGYAEGTIRNKVSAGEIPFLKIGKALRFRRRDIDRWIADQTAAAQEQVA